MFGERWLTGRPGRVRRLATPRRASLSYTAAALPEQLQGEPAPAQQGTPTRSKHERHTGHDSCGDRHRSKQQQSRSGGETTGRRRRRGRKSWMGQQ